MDITLTRILSLFPTKQDGKPVHGSGKELSDYLGLPHNAVTEWKSGRNKSYMRYLHEIAAKYGVSVEWLKGETDEKTPPAGADGVSEKDRVILELSKQLSEDQKDLLIAQLKILGAQK